MTNTKQWVIMGYYKNCNYACLVYTLPPDYTEEQAIMVLNRMAYHPTHSDLTIIGEDAEHLWLEEVDDAWWNN